MPFVVAILVLTAPAFAQRQDQGNRPMPNTQGHQGMMPGQDMPGMTMPSDPASRAYMEAMRKMNQDMMGKPMTGDADRDFATMMMTHHQGAMDMARVELDHGKDPTLKKMAQKVIDDQSKEIKELQGWLQKHQAK